MVLEQLEYTTGYLAEIASRPCAQFFGMTMSHEVLNTLLIWEATTSAGMEKS
jgi:hypothetical protein